MNYFVWCTSCSGQAWVRGVEDSDSVAVDFDDRCEWLWEYDGEDKVQHDTFDACLHEDYEIVTVEYDDPIGDEVI